MQRRFAAIDGRGVISVETEETGEPGKGEVLVEVEASLVSPGTELGGVKGRRENPNPDAGPRMFGYQNAGVIIAKGEGVEEREIGDRVACMGGGYAPHATYGICPKNLTSKLPDDVSFEEGAFNHLAATALQAIRRTGPLLGETMGVVGLGLVGQEAAQLARLSGMRVVGFDRLPLRLEIAKKCGCYAVCNSAEEDPKVVVDEVSEGYGLDAAIIAFGGDGTEAFKQLLGLMKRSPDGHQMGRIIIVGGARVNTTYAASTGNLDVRSSARTGPGYHDEEWERGFTQYPPVFMDWTTPRNLRECLRLISEGRLDVKSLITDEVPLSQAPEACEKLIQEPDKAMGVIFHPKE